MTSTAKSTTLIYQAWFQWHREYDTYGVCVSVGERDPSHKNGSSVFQVRSEHEHFPLSCWQREMLGGQMGYQSEGCWFDSQSWQITLCPWARHFTLLALGVGIGRYQSFSFRSDTKYFQEQYRWHRYQYRYFYEIFVFESFYNAFWNPSLFILNKPP